MPTKLGIAFVGLTLGGVTFLISGLAVSLMIGQFQHAVAPAATQASVVQYAQLPQQ
jgi:hypothetical protein